MITERDEIMRENYTAPEMEITVFENEDVITESEPELIPQ